MTRSSIVFLALLASAGAGCQGSTPGDAESTGAATGATTGAVSTSNTADTEDTDSTDGLGSHEVCEDYIACIGAANPEALPAALATYGSDGACWTGSASQIDVCLNTCRTGQEIYHDTFPDVEECAFCTTNADCDAGQVCFEGDCAMGCGDGLVTGDEVCDTQEGCDADCRGPGCSPLTDAGCDGEGVQCLMQDYGPGEGVQAYCYPPSETPPYGEACLDGVCGPGLACVESGLVADCGEQWCCTNYCDLNVPESCPAGTACTAYSPNEMPAAPSLSYLGLCLPPG